MSLFNYWQFNLLSKRQFLAPGIVILLLIAKQSSKQKRELALPFLSQTNEMSYFTEATTASNASGLFIARSASTLRFRVESVACRRPMNWE